MEASSRKELAIKLLAEGREDTAVHALIELVNKWEFEHVDRRLEVHRRWSVMFERWTEKPPPISEDGLKVMLRRLFGDVPLAVRFMLDPDKEGRNCLYKVVHLSVEGDELMVHGDTLEDLRLYARAKSGHYHCEPASGRGWSVWRL